MTFLYSVFLYFSLKYMSLHKTCEVTNAKMNISLIKKKLSSLAGVASTPGIEPVTRARIR